MSIKINQHKSLDSCVLHEARFREIELLADYCDLIIWYHHQLNMPRYYCGEGLCVARYNGREIFVDLLEWTMNYNHSEYKIPCTRTQFADKLAWCLAEHECAKMLICMLPQPIAEEMLPHINACERTIGIMGTFLVSTIEN